MDPTRVFLTGFMGAGKSTVGRRLATVLDRPFFDTDELVEHGTGRTIDQIFREDGEGAFRAAEERALDDLESVGDAVVATGGGLFLGASQRRTMKRLGFVVWLDVSLAVALARVGTGDGRPLWLPDDPLAFRAWFDRRRATYALAHARVDADGAPDVVARAAIAKLHPRFRAAPDLSDP